MLSSVEFFRPFSLSGTCGSGTIGGVAVEWLRLSLSLRDYEPPRALVAPPKGIELSSLQEWGDTASHRRSIYELNKTCSADIPDRGEFFRYEEYEPLRFEAAGVRPDGFVLAFDETEVVGLCQLTCPPGRRWAFIEMTGVLPAYRRQGLATAMKLEALVAAKSWGCSEVRTFHHPDNKAIIAANRALGFRDADFDV